MSEEKFDSLATGSHRAWVGESAPNIVRPASHRDGSKPWTERPQPPNSRHSAITRTLHTFPNYKSWADKVKNSWDKDK
jgi:hypothetical protein